MRAGKGIGIIWAWALFRLLKGDGEAKHYAGPIAATVRHGRRAIGLGLQQP
jgi:hypothetical protein